MKSQKNNKDQTPAEESIFDRFKRLADIKPIPVDCQGWGRLYVKPMTVAEAEAVADPDPKKDTMPKAVCYALCDANGKRVFSAADPEHLAMIKAQGYAWMVDFLSKAQRLTGVGVEGAEDAKKA